MAGSTRMLRLVDTSERRRVGIADIPAMVEAAIPGTKAFILLNSQGRYSFETKLDLCTTRELRDSLLEHALAVSLAHHTVVVDETAGTAFEGLRIAANDAHGVIAVPLLDPADFALGFLLITRASPGEWDDDVQQTAEMYAQMITTELGAGRTALQHEAIVAFSDIAALSNSGGTEILDQALRLGMEYLEADHACVIQEGVDMCTTVTSIHAASDTVPDTCPSVVLSNLFDSRTLVAIPDLNAFPSLQDVFPGLRSMIGIRYSKKRIIVFHSHYPYPRESYGSAEREFVFLLSRWIKAREKHQQAADELARKERVDAIILRAQRKFILNQPPVETFSAVLDSILDVLDAEYGFIGDLLDDPEYDFPVLRARAMTNVAWDEGTRQRYEAIFTSGYRLPSPEAVFNHTVRKDDVILSNDPGAEMDLKRVPKGHPPTRSYLGLPLRFADETIGVMGIANAKDGFTEDMVALLEPLTFTIGYMLNSLRVQEEQAAAAREIARLSIVAQEMPSGVFITDHRYQIEWCNSAISRMLGFDSGQLLGTFAPHVLYGKLSMSPEWLNRVAAILEEDKPFFEEVQIIRQNGKALWAEIRAIAFRTDPLRPPGYLVVVTDVSQRKAAEQVKSDFVSMVSHELRTPLTAIRGALEIVDAGAAGELPASAARMIHVASSNAKRLGDLINDLLDVEKLARGDADVVCQPHDLTKLVISTVEANTAYAEKLDVTYEFDSHANGVVVDVDPLRFGQVLTNLLSNAAKFSHPGGIIEVRSEHDGSYVTISVTDHGEGIPEEFRERVFEKFAQADSSSTRNKNGTGLGLAISKILTERMKGDIWFTTETGKGTTFFVRLPVSEMLRTTPSADISSMEDMS